MSDNKLPNFNTIDYNTNVSTPQVPTLAYADISDIKVGYIQSVTSKAIEQALTMDEYLMSIKNGTYKGSVEAYRNFIENILPIDLKSADARGLKLSVPCCIPHSGSPNTPISNQLPQNGFMQIDIDCPSLANLYVSDEQIIQALDMSPYIFAYHKSVGGKGYVGYAFTEDSISKSFWVVANDLQSRGLYVDLSKGVGTGEKRFMSYDADLVIKEHFVPVKAAVGIDKNSIIKDYTWHKPSSKRLADEAEKAFANWVKKNGCFDWTSTGPAAPAGLLAGVVSKHEHILSQAELMQLADWCVYLYNDEIIVPQDRAAWEQYLNQYGKQDNNSSFPQPVANHCTKNSAVASAGASVVDWRLVFPGLAVHYCTTTLTSILQDIDKSIRGW
jgi:hypothetical protein